MNARLIKETRDLLPMFAGTLLLIVVPQLIWHACAGFGCCRSGRGLRGDGRELLWQRVPAPDALAAALTTHRPLGALARQDAGPGSRHADEPGRVAGLPGGAPSRASTVQDWLALVLIPLCAFCGAPFWTLLLRHGIGGMVFAVGAPFAILAVYALVTAQLGDNKPDTLVSASVVLLLIYCALVYWLGYARFKRLEVVDGPARELSLPAGLEAFLRAATDQGFFALPRTVCHPAQEGVSPAADQLPAGRGVRPDRRGRRLPGPALPRLGRRHCGRWIARSYVVILPLIAGAISRGGRERLGHGRMASDLAALRAQAVVGQNAGRPFHQPGPGPAAAGRHVPGRASPVQPARRRELPFRLLPRFWAGCSAHLLLTSVAVYAASFSNSTLRAILAAFAIIAAGCGVCALLGHWAADCHTQPLVDIHARFRRRFPSFKGADTTASSRRPVPHAVPGPMVCLVQLPALCALCPQDCRPTPRHLFRPRANHASLRLGSLSPEPQVLFQWSSGPLIKCPA